MTSLLNLLIIASFSSIIGSFLNVVIYRYPIMLYQKSSINNFNLLWPRSHCAHCKQTIAFRRNIPIISFVLLKSRCFSCKEKISLIYPLVEIVTALSTTWIFYRYGFNMKSIAICLLTWNLIVLSFIDLKYFLLPDSLTLSFLWLGLFFNSNNLIISPTQAITGAIFGYLSLWSVALVFKYVKKQEGMGYGDFKMLAMLGAWLGFLAISKIILIAVCSALLISIALIFLNRIHKDQPIPFGPFLALAGWIQVMGLI